MKKLCLVFIGFIFVVTTAQAATQPDQLAIAKEQTTAAFEHLDAGINATLFIRNSDEVSL